MKLRGICLVFLTVALVANSGCIFKPSRYTGVISYRHGRAYIKHDKYYRIGLLPEGWQRMKTRARTISFYNSELLGSISTDAFCAKGLGDRNLSALSMDILGGLEEKNFLDIREFELDRRGALRQKVSGKMDGVPVIVDLVVTKKNGCAFDFYSVASPPNSQEVTEAFEDFFGAFQYD